MGKCLSKYPCLLITLQHQAPKHADGWKKRKGEINTCNEPDPLMSKCEFLEHGCRHMKSPKTMPCQSSAPLCACCSAARSDARVLLGPKRCSSFVLNTYRRQNSCCPTEISQTCLSTQDPIGEQLSRHSSSPANLCSDPSLNWT